MPDFFQSPAGQPQLVVSHSNTSALPAAGTGTAFRASELDAPQTYPATAPGLTLAPIIPAPGFDTSPVVQSTVVIYDSVTALLTGSGAAQYPLTGQRLPWEYGP